MGKEKFFIIPGLLVAMATGGLMPFFGLLLGNLIGVLSKFESFKNPSQVLNYTKEDVLWETDKYIIGLFGISFVAWLVNFLMNSIFSYVGQNFTLNLRKVYFRRMLF